MSKEFRNICNLEENNIYREENPEEAFSDEEIAVLKQIQTGDDIKSIVVGDEWIDDHEICVNLTVNGIEFSAWWIVRKFYKAIIRAEAGNKTGKEQLAEFIKEFTTTINLGEE